MIQFILNILSDKHMDRACNFFWIKSNTDYGRPERKYPSLHGRKFNPNPKFLGTAEGYFVCHIGQKFQISLIDAFIGCP